MPIEKFQHKYRISSARAAWHDYNGGIYFVTICTQNNQHFFGEIQNSTMLLNEIGQFAFDNLQDISTHYPYAEIPLFVVMPNHLHAIVFIDGENGRITRHCRDVARYVSTDSGTDKHSENNEKMVEIAKHQSLLGFVIRGLKSATTKFANQNNIPFAWQTRFHDRIIRSQNEINRIAEYIENNPARWDADCFNRQAGT
jgi:REP element-mobilizing transposase RayT